MKRFLIYISQPYSIPIGKPLEMEIEKRGYICKWFCDEKLTQDNFSDTSRLLQNVEDVMHYHPDIVLVATNVVPDFFPGIKVQVFHGFSVGKRSASKGHFNIRGFFDLYCTQGPSTTEPFMILQDKYQYFEVIETGWSKVDPLFPLLMTKKEEDRLPTVMISSTFTTRLSLAKNEEMINEIKRLSYLGKWHFIAVLHPKMEKEVVEQFKAMEHEYFTFYDTTELIPLFQQADVMLSDTTSAIAEFVLQKKPVVTIRNNQPESYMVNIEVHGEMEDALEVALSKPNALMQEIDFFIARTHPSNDGKSSARVIDASLKVLDRGSKRKPLNLIRRFKIRKKLNYWKVW
ncbi:MAG: CDP-glycerol: N-acetyl-beta-D-mannosaminyl-1,4-N-acetyl-D-glucosaminyldiphosphoundecaprenyl glycerophosphotransferase [uncultured Sulfurovum sp.]|uniref:CDP-glycerol: N-acetyl-beta-D-mannosaminyl-1,4-N-acetyl-D-glucosaminyldip hosphoundecaprenyl glycerophosphotransferase n=1 Tax=uncultured Sulfurovum sp. TaxID=269237 RepID=A0A6S6TK05_9BACT|nr:MAG: CDP-glycerol: N-acetyl-beta-D-mannosaminyl-1,4-N-acetyl-D-glucosaminyldiphosphoundecaprenyl glycerophosphotransferase [uncultured Sulfurovum sp.]